MNLFPETASALIDELDRIYPEKPASPERSREEDIAYGAKRELVLFLKRWRESARAARPAITRRPRR